MGSNTLDEVLKRIDKIEERITNIENENTSIHKTQLYSPPQKTEYVQKTEPYSKTHATIEKSSIQKESRFLGYVGATCILLASILLIKLSIDSGWLTPIRQCLFASIFAGSLIFFPFYIHLKDKNYISILPALGVAILHLTTYGAVFYHKLLDPTLGLVSISLIGVLSIWLLVKLEKENYAVFAIFGTYLGAFFFHNSFSELSTMALYLFAWDMAFSIFSIKLKKRFIIMISCYLALGLVAFFGLIKGYGNNDFNSKIMIIQGVQFLIFSLGTVLFSIRNKLKLTADEAWGVFPIIIFFYGQEYFFLDRISEDWATIFSMAFAGFLLATYGLAKKKLQNIELDSGNLVYTACSVIFAHSIFIVEMNDFVRIIFTFWLVLVFGLLNKKLLENKALKGTIIVAGCILLHSYLSVIFGASKVSLNSLIIFGAIFGAIFSFFSKKIKSSHGGLILNLAHAQFFVTIFRLKKFTGALAIAPIWIAYTFGILYWASRNKDKDMARGAIPLVVISLGRFIIIDFHKFDGLQRIVSLLIIGVLVFAGGYLYRIAAKED